jgi:hypothetical protein
MSFEPLGNHKIIEIQNLAILNCILRESFLTFSMLKLFLSVKLVNKKATYYMCFVNQEI